MAKKFIALCLSSFLLISACTSGPIASQAQKAGRAMADSTCLLFDPDLDLERIAEMSDGIVKGYGFEDSESIDSYLLTIAGTEELNEVSVALRERLIETCGKALEDGGLDPADLSDAILTELE